MAVFPYFVLSPNTITSLVGILHGPDPTLPTPPEDWRRARVNVVIPARNEEANLPLALASVARQTLRPQRVILVDDGSEDRTLEYAREFCEENDIELIAIHRRVSIGKTPTIKRQAREFPADVEFILDGDTVLTSPEYIARTVEELYQAVGIACACGTILPMREKDRCSFLEWEPVRRFLEHYPDAPVRAPEHGLARLLHALTNLYRDTLYTFLQGIVYRGEMVFFGSITSPVGCAVAYRQEYVRDLFDFYEPILGDDLTNSEDIFIGFALLNEGYRNIQLHDVYARTVEPPLHRLPRQIYLWSSAFYQACYYFNSLVASPFRAARRGWHKHHLDRDHHQVLEKRKIREPYRQPFGREQTRRLGRPIGWTILMGAIEKVAFPVLLLLMVWFGWWEALAVTLVAESTISIGFLTWVAKGHRLEYLGKGLLTVPIRYGSLLVDLYTMGRFATDLWVLRDRRWRK